MKVFVGLLALSCIHVAHAELIDTSTQRFVVPVSPMPSIDNQPTADVATDKAAHINLTPSPSTTIPNDPTDDWVDERRQDTKVWLNKTAHRLDTWFGRTNPNKPANASLRIMLDVYDNKYDGTSFKPKIRGRLRLPALENRLSVIIGDDELEYYDNAGWHVALDSPKERFDGKQIRNNNTSFAFRLSKWQDEKGIETDADIGIRSGNDIYGRLRADKKWHYQNNLIGHFEQIYRYGSKSEHFLRSNYILNKTLSSTRTLTNHSYLEYTHQDDEKIIAGNTLYQTHTYPMRLGERKISYGVNLAARVDEAVWDNSYGAFVNYRQPIWKDWLFIQSELTYYNHKVDNKDHHLASFLRLEVQF